ncbi:DUF6231 family protein [Acinetobacter sp. ANC 4641]|uniref:DUF6231 family protein n=1 Tax=Acinetobacter sp. ANC 4641 TaxID=2529847 RepID=UPI00103B2509|nr:DUF6231 family protein [Acinetobacter sp. ANC 4641]TCB12430.1 hypothetical protein E0H78_04380 [Acinetobacter sp. ANC 4641]
MAEQNVITSMLDDLCQEQPIETALCIGQDLCQHGLQHSIDWQYFNVSDFLSLPFTRRYDLGFILLDTPEMQNLGEPEKSQLLVKLRDLMAKRLVVVCQSQDVKLMRALGLTQMLDKTQQQGNVSLWQFNILTYKHVPDWFNSKFWANPENWDKFRW